MKEDEKLRKFYKNVTLLKKMLQKFQKVKEQCERNVTKLVYIYLRNCYNVTELDILQRSGW